ncbi:hypothetical protein ETU08_07590 [Apibacter muscae]|uniref:hypothetical protein n=1 Tax=Apibacter muscae TaxID=2509004 RepID=UPI0011ADA112|nr:hypothetical protein [Apibacter muscae]TWP29355.1 hypothetical protein ETU08_07590 [Apibacter muscae]
MKKYSLSLSNYFPKDTKIKVYELCKQGVSYFDNFYTEIEDEGNSYSDLVAAIRIIEDTSNLLLRPKGQFRKLQTSNSPYKLYEAKKGIIRIYLFHEEHKGRVMVLGGKKDNQKKDIDLFQKIIKEYYEEQNKK